MRITVLLTDHNNPPDLERFRRSRPALVVEYTDPHLGCRGWFVRHTMEARICAGGMRVQAGLDRNHLEAMARNMTLKMRVAGINVDGAKSGIDLDPASPHRTEVMQRFLAAIAPYVRSFYSMGPDLNVTYDELGRLLAEQGIPAPKAVIARAQGMPLGLFHRRHQVLDQEVLPGWTVNRLRAGWGVAAAVSTVLEHLGIEPQSARVAIQGFGQVGRATALALARRGVRLVALGDIHGTLVAADGIPRQTLETLLAGDTTLASHATHHRDQVLFQPCDVLVAAAVEETITAANAAFLRCRAVVPGANLAVSPIGEAILRDGRVPVVPDFVAGCGGSLAMEILFGSETIPSPEAVLTHVDARMHGLVRDTIELAADHRLSWSEAAYQLARRRHGQADLAPYTCRHGCPPN